MPLWEIAFIFYNMKQVNVLFILIITSGFTAPLIAAAQQKASAIKSDLAALASSVNVKNYGATGDGSHDDYSAIQKACNFCIANPSACTAIRFPVGTYLISHPIILQKVSNERWQFFTLHLFGDAPAKSGADGYLSTIKCAFTEGFGIGIQFGRGIQIENINIEGAYSFPNTINNYNIGTTLYASWNNGSVQDGRYSPYAGICIDPFCDSNKIKSREGYPSMRKYYLSGTGKGGTSGVEIKQCGIHHFMVGAMLTPNPYTQNDEMINFLDDNIDAVKVAIAIGQDQSKEIHIDRLKVWASTYTIVDGLNYGAGSAPGSIMINGMNIAGNVNQIFNINAGRFPLSALNIYAESLFRIGFVNGTAGVNFTNFQIDLLTGPGMPAADYIFSGGPVTWSGGMLRYYDASYTHRMNLSQMLATFQDMTLSNPPMVIGLYAYGINGHPTPSFRNIHLYYGNRPMKADFEALHALPFVPLITVDKTKWLASFPVIPGISFKPGDYILASPTDKTGRYFDSGMNPGECSTIQIGRVISITGNTVNLDDVGLNAYSGKDYGAVYLDTVK